MQPQWRINLADRYKSNHPHIAIVTTSFPIQANGQEAAGSFVYDLCRELGRHTRVSVVAPYCSDKAPSAKINICWYRVPRLPLSLLSPANPVHWPAILTALRSGHRALLSLVNGSHPPDHILCLWALPCGYWARSIASISGIPYSIWALGSDIWTLGKVPVVRKILGRVLHDAQHCFADGLDLVRMTSELAGRSCRFLPSSRLLCDEPPQQQPSDQPPFRLAFLGRWHINKGVDLLLDALNIIDSKTWNDIASVRITGGGPLAPDVLCQSEALQKQGRPVSVEGYKNRDEARELMQWADYIIIPSRIESIPVIFSDAMQSARPVISTPVGDLAQLLRRYNAGILAADATADAIADAIGTAVQRNPRTISAGLTEAAKQFDLRHTAKVLLEHLSGK